MDRGLKTLLESLTKEELIKLIELLVYAKNVSKNELLLMIERVLK